jgi:hypothetical protein
MEAIRNANKIFVRKDPEERDFLEDIGVDGIRLKLKKKEQDVKIVCIATDYGLDDRGGRSSSPGRVKNFLFSRSSRPALGPNQPAIQCVTGALPPGREASHSPPASAEVKKMWDPYIHSPIRLYDVVLN